MTKEEEFWNWFKKNEAQFFFLNQIDDGDEKERILDELLAQLHIYCDKLYFEVGGEPDQKQDLIITAEGNQDYFDQVELLVRQAPHLEHWNVIAFKPIREDGTIEIDDVQLNPKTMCFMPLNSKNSEKLGLRIYIDNFNPADTETYLKAIFLVLDNLLGEKSNALDIGYVEIEDLATYPQKEDLIELTKLASYVSWNKKRIPFKGYMDTMIYRTAEVSDVKQMQVVRHLVKENTLSNPDLVPDKDVIFYISEKGKGWVCETDGRVIGFSIVDLSDKSVWALFVDPAFEAKGIGKELHRLMMDWYFEQTPENIQLGTAPNTRAERFYQLQGWTQIGTYANGEVKFELTYQRWMNRSL